MRNGRPTSKRRISYAAATQIGFFIAICLAALFLFLEYDLFTHADERSEDEVRIEIEEALALATLLIVGLFVFSYRRMRDQTRELERRLAAETKAREALELAMLDPLTGLANRRHFDDIFNAAADKGPAPTHALLLIDLDDFKSVNDTHGHDAGDHVLKVVSARVQHVMKENDVVARLGGDELAAIAFHISEAQRVQTLAQRLMSKIEEPIEFKGRHVVVTASIGFTLFPENGIDAQEIFRRADKALYRGKANKSDRQAVQG